MAQPEAAFEGARHLRRQAHLCTPRRRRCPHFVPPQLATLASAPPEGRAGCTRSSTTATAPSPRSPAIAAVFTRGQARTGPASSPPSPHRCASSRSGSALLDGEIVALDEKGRSSFQRLQNALKEGRIPLTYYVFDILELDGRDLRGQPLVRRKEILKSC